MARYLVSVRPDCHRGLRDLPARAIATGMSGTILSILMLAGIALGVGGIYMIGWKQDAKRGWLMIVAAMVMFMNVMIWTVPVAEPDGAGVVNAVGE